jgi:hypothetical protein
MQRIHSEDKIVWDSIIKDELESEALGVRDCMLYCVRYAKEQLKDKNVPSSDKLEWINTLQGTRTNILKLLVEGPEYLRSLKQVYPPRIQVEPQTTTDEMRESHENIKKKLARRKKIIE